MPQLSKKLITVVIATFILLGLVFFYANPELLNGVFASNPPAVVDVKLKILTDGVAPFEATTADSSALTDAGDDQNTNNQLVRAGDNVTYEVQLNAINLNTSDITAVVVLDKGRWLALPSTCLISPTVSAAKASSISADGRTLTCNTGIIVEGTATFVDIVARADNTPNNTPLNASIVASANGAANKTAPSVGVVITSRPTVDIVKYADTQIINGNTDFSPALERYICKNGNTYTQYDPNNAASCTAVGDVKGHNFIYKFKLQHSRVGDEQLASPFNVTLDDAFTYVSGYSATNNATLSSCTVEVGYAASSGAISCGASVGGLTQNRVITLTGVDDSQTGADGIIGNYVTKYFVPLTDFGAIVPPATVATINSSNIITGRSSAGAPAFEGAWDPSTTSGASNYGGATEKSSTCATDPGAGFANASCNNRVDLSMVVTQPGSFCPDVISSGSVTIQSCGLGLKGNTLVTPGQNSRILLYDSLHANSDPTYQTATDTICSTISIDSAGNPLFQFTGLIPDFPHIQGSGQQNNFYTSPSGAAFTDATLGDGTIVGFGTKPGATTASENIEPSFEFSTTPIVGNVPGTSDRLSNCDNTVGNWVKWTGNGSIPTGTTLTRFRMITQHKKNTAYTHESYVWPQVKMNSNLATLTSFCATNGAGSDCAIPIYSSYKVDASNGASIIPWTYALGNTVGGTLNNTKGSANNVTFQSGRQDIFYLATSTIGLVKSNDLPVAKPGDTVDFTLTPTYNGGGTSTLTIVDTLPAGLSFVAGSYPSICTVSGQVMTCTYTNATAGTGLTPATITYKALVSPNLGNAYLTNQAVISSSNAQVNTDSKCPVAGAAFAITSCSWASNVSVVTPGAYYIEKRLMSPQVDEVDQDLKYDLTIKNLGSKALGAQEYIEVFPFNGDNGNYTNRVSNPSPSNFSGTVEYKSIILPTGVTVTAYTTDAPNTIKLDPKCKSNTSAANWIDGTPTISTTNQQGTDWVNYCGSSDTATNWIVSSTPPANATAIKLSSAVIAVNATAPIVNLVLHTKNNHEGDRYTNNFSGRATTIDLPVVSNDVTSTVVDGSIGDLVWSDDNKNGVQDAGEKGFANVPVSATWYGPDGILGTADDMTFTTTTDSNGIYNINYLPSGKYDVTVTTPPTGYAPTYDTDGIATPNVVESVTLTKTTDVSGNVTTVSDNTNTDFGYAGYKIEGDVYVDLNKDLLHGVLPSCSTTSPLTTECGIPSVVVSLLDATTGAVIQTTTTDALGQYKFTNIPNGTYNIVETQPNAYTSENTNIMPVTMAGVDLTGKDFAELTAMFSGYVYVDSNNDGVKDTGEAGISGVTIKLTGTDVDGNVVSFSTTTDSNGLYTFPNLRAGNYNLMELQPTTYGDGKDTVGTTGGLLSNDMISNITLTPGANSTKNNFGEVVQDKVKLSGTVWVDTNGDGVLDSSETSRVAGTTITITDLMGNVIGTTVTDSNGYYQMIVNPGTYIITETQPTGYGSSTPNVLQAVVTTDSANNNFGENTKGSISGVVYVDKNNDGVQDPGENGIPNTTVTLSNGTVVKTNSAGAYVFPNLVAGTYDITETQPNYVDGKDTSPVGVVTNDKVSSIPVTLASDTLGVYFGEQGGSISGNVFVDADKSTVKNGSEVNLPNVVLTLKDSSGNVVATTTTDSSGNYKFDGLALGTYSIVETQPDGYASTTPDTLSATVSSSSKDVSSLNYGEIQAGKIKGVVYYDPNKNGVKDPTENTGIAGATIQVKDSSGNVVATVMTDSTGNYEVGGLPFGTYTVSVKEPTGWVSTTVEVVSGTVSTVNLVVNFGAVKDLAKTGGDLTMILIGFGVMVGLGVVYKRRLVME